MDLYGFKKRTHKDSEFSDKDQDEQHTHGHDIDIDFTYVYPLKSRSRFMSGCLVSSSPYFAELIYRVKLLLLTSSYSHCDAMHLYVTCR